MERLQMNFHKTGKKATFLSVYYGNYDEKMGFDIFCCCKFPADGV
jgi:hypothetical protein